MYDTEIYDLDGVYDEQQILNNQGFYTVVKDVDPSKDTFKIEVYKDLESFED